jgi:hypothetical protein
MTSACLRMRAASNARRMSFNVYRLGLTPCSDGSRATRGVRVLLIYLLTDWSRVLFEKIISSQLIKKFPAFYGNRRFITRFYTCPPPIPMLSQMIQSCPHIPITEDSS